MNLITKTNAIIELRYLEQPLSKLRQRTRAAYLRVAESLQRDSQLLPVTVVPAEKETHRWILIDGHLRVGALRTLGADTVQAEVWSCDISTALILLMTSTQQRHWEVIEQARLLDVLHNECGLSQAKIANSIARDVSWVSRRLSLVKDISPKAFAAYSEGKIATWALNRVIQPLARANSEHADQLIHYLYDTTQSTRELQKFFEHYQRSNLSIRQKMVENPELFFKTLEAKHIEKEAQILAAGPEGRWLNGLRFVQQKVQELKSLVKTVFYPGQEKSQQALLKKNFWQTQKSFREFETTSQELIHVNTARTSNDSDAKK